MKTSRQSQSGSSLLAVLFFMVLTSLTVAMIFQVTDSHVVATNRTQNRAIAVAYADGVLDSLFDQWRTAMTNVTNATDRAYGMSTSALTTALTPPSSSTLPTPTGVSLASWSVTAQTPLLVTTTDPNGRPTLEDGTNSSSRVRVYYRAIVTVNYKTLGGTYTASVQRIFNRQGRNIFDNFFFGTQPNVEFQPGPDMYVNGSVYVGGNLYTAQNAIHFLSDVTYTGQQVLNYRPTDSRYGNTTPTIGTGPTGFAANWSLSDPPHVGSQQKLLDVPLTSLDPNFIDDPISNDSDSDGNPNNNGYHEIVEQVTNTAMSDPLQLDSLDSERLPNNADYRIVVNSTNSVTIYEGSSTTPLATTNAQYQALYNSLTLNTAMTDDREGDNVRMVTMDVSKLNAAATAGTIVSSVTGNGGYLIWIDDTSSGTSVSTNIVNSQTGAKTAVTSNHMRGVKLINGGTIPSGGLTIASPNPVYVQGDFNTGSTSTAQPASNTTTPYVPPTNTPSPVVGSYTKPPAAIAGDAINILSNNWNDANSPNSLSARVASSTTVNAALVGGSVPTTTSSYSGGVENFTRFHEDWSSTYLTIYGALAMLYDSEQATHPWSNASYNPPNRCWFYDNLFLNSNPPGFTAARVYSRGERIQF
jgi:hypothetical protein